MTQQQEQWYRYNMARRQSLTHAYARIMNGGAQGAAAGGGQPWNSASAPMYDLVSPEVMYTTTTTTNDTAAVTLQNRASNEVTVGSDVTSLEVVFPAAIPGKMRDFILRLVVTGQTAPELTFVEQDGTPVPFDATDDSWAEVEPGVNILLFSDTSEEDESSSGGGI